MSTFPIKFLLESHSLSHSKVIIQSIKINNNINKININNNNINIQGFLFFYQGEFKKA